MTANYRHYRMFLFLIGLSFVLTACGGGGGGSTDCDTPLTVNYVNNEFLTEDLFVLGGYSASDTTLIHMDGNQGSPFDIDRIILSRITHTSGNSLALSYSIYATTSPSNDTFIALYIDTDNNQATGEIIGNIGADALILDDGNIFSVNSPFLFDNYYEWNGVGDNWDAQVKLGSLSGSASYFEGCTLSSAVYAPLYSGLEALYATNVRGVMKIITLSDADPNTPTGVIDSTTEFNFMIP